jgi:hypothetical protein
MRLQARVHSLFRHARKDLKLEPSVGIASCKETVHPNARFIQNEIQRRSDRDRTAFWEIKISPCAPNLVEEESASWSETFSTAEMQGGGESSWWRTKGGNTGGRRRVKEREWNCGRERGGKGEDNQESGQGGYRLDWGCGVHCAGVIDM